MEGKLLFIGTTCSSCGQRRGCRAPGAPAAQLPPGWEAALARSELALLQRHLLRTLRSPDTAGEAEPQYAMASFVHLNNALIRS